MNIVVIGSGEQATECRQKFGANHNWRTGKEVSQAKVDDGWAEVIFDFCAPEIPSQLSQYPSDLSAIVFLDTSGVSLISLAEGRPLNRTRLFGFCGLPTLINREVLEVSTLADGEVKFLASVCEKLGTPFETVADQAGMVSARVICMIINEAFYTFEEGTATREDIDLAMKLGTNYPFGPFEWANRIGLARVVRVLKGAGLETGDERYRICPLLMKEAGLS